MMGNNRVVIYGSAGLIAFTLMMALLTFLFSGYLVTYTLLSEEKRAYFFEAPHIVAAYGSQPMIGPVTSYRYVEHSPGVGRHVFHMIIWSNKGMGQFGFVINSANWQDLRTWFLTSPTGDILRRPPCRRY